MNTAVNEESKKYSIPEDKNQKNIESQDIYDIVKNFVVENMGDGLEIGQASEQFNNAKGQMKDWMKRLCDDEILLCKKGMYYKNE